MCKTALHLMRYSLLKGWHLWLKLTARLPTLTLRLELQSDLDL